MGSKKKIIAYILVGVILAMLLIFRREIARFVGSLGQGYLLLGTILLLLSGVIIIFLIFRSAKKRASVIEKPYTPAVEEDTREIEKKERIKLKASVKKSFSIAKKNP